MYRKVSIILCLVLFVIAVTLLNAQKSNTNKVEQLEKENIQLREENLEQEKQILKLEKENKELIALLQEQNRILETLAKAKRFSQKLWDSFKEPITDLNKRINKKVEEMKQTQGGKAK